MLNVGDRVKAIIRVYGNPNSPFTRTGKIILSTIRSNSLVMVKLDEPIDGGTPYQMDTAYARVENCSLIS